jgi:hypothetical protein
MRPPTTATDLETELLEDGVEFGVGESDDLRV